MSLLIAVLATATTYWLEWQNLQQRVFNVAEEDIALVIGRTRQLAAMHSLSIKDAFFSAVEEHRQNPHKPREGKFVDVLIFEANSADFAYLPEPGYPSNGRLHELLDELRQKRPLPDQPISETIHTEQGVYIRALVPIKSRTGAVIAYAGGLFAPNPAYLQTMAESSLRAAGRAIVVVLFTAGLLYPVIRDLLKRLTQSSSELLLANLETVSLLGCTIAKRDSDTEAHNFRVTLYSIHLAETLGLQDDEINRLIMGAFLHDVGKIAIPDHILLKKGRLTEDEFAIMKTHVQHGLDIISRVHWLAEASPVVSGHHEKFDGSGYPARLVGQQIPLVARIFAVADVFDALTSRRPYKEPLTYQDTMAILKQGDGKHFDPEVLDTFTGISADLYARYSGRDDDGLRQDLMLLAAPRLFPNIDNLSFSKVIANALAVK